MLVVFLAFPGAALIDISGPIAAFKSAMHASDLGRSQYEIAIASLGGGIVQTLEGVGIETVLLAGLPNIHTLIVPGGGTEALEHQMSDGSLVDWISRSAPNVKRLCSVCTGTFLLAAAGLTNGKRVATHWAYCDKLSMLFPKTIVDRESIYVKAGNLWTSAGATSGIDLALALIEQDFDRRTASEVARFLVVYLRRPSGQSQFSVLLESQANSESRKFEALERWIGENTHLPLSVCDLADHVAMIPRNFARMYLKERGRTPGTAVRLIRIETAKRLLTETSESLRLVSHRCGFSDEEGLKKAFIREVGISPKEYRDRFAL